MEKDQIETIESLEASGFVILLKWDGERERRKRSVVITLPKTDHVFYRDTDDIDSTLNEALYWANKIMLH